MPTSGQSCVLRREQRAPCDAFQCFTVNRCFLDPWPVVPLCTCGTAPVVMLRDRLGAELKCPNEACRREWAVWFSAEETALVDAYMSVFRHRWQFPEESPTPELDQPN